jgi:glycosyltransferase involved in cell wall biosynthesis
VRLVLWGDGESPHLIKWARALAPRVDLWAASSRGFAPSFDALVPKARRLALDTVPAFEGGNAGLLLRLPRFARWLRVVRPDWIHAHYLSSHGTLAWLATRLLGAPGRIAGTAWGSDILVAPRRSATMRWITRRVLAACAVATSDSRHMADRMRELGADEVLVLPFGLESMPPAAVAKDDHRWFANRGLEPIYRPQRVLLAFEAMARAWPDARLVVAHDGTLRASLEAQAASGLLAGRVSFVGRLDAAEQARHYDRARWYCSLPESDAVSVSVLEAMAHGCIPILSDLPANRELVRDGHNGMILADGALPDPGAMQALLGRAADIAAINRAWVAEHAMFDRSVAALLDRLRAIDAGAAR